MLVVVSNWCLPEFIVGVQGLEGGEGYGGSWKLVRIIGVGDGLLEGHQIGVKEGGEIG